MHPNQKKVKQRPIITGGVMAHEIYVVRIAQDGTVDRDPVKLSLKENQRLV